MNDIPKCKIEAQEASRIAMQNFLNSGGVIQKVGIDNNVGHAPVIDNIAQRKRKKKAKVNLVNKSIYENLPKKATELELLRYWQSWAEKLNIETKTVRNRFRQHKRLIGVK